MWKPSDVLLTLVYSGIALQVSNALLQLSYYDSSSKEYVLVLRISLVIGTLCLLNSTGQVGYNVDLYMLRNAFRSPFESAVFVCMVSARPEGCNIR